ncbi:DUF4062 domain-containing protein [Prosthecobacter sp.]|uniref:DUF4062 domain-containing protein n=1 Tax=Prosthecobacter sp. TaxID=1965333 RepID=UPI0037839FBA
MNPPKVFISATSGDLRSIRQLVKDALLTINCHPVEQTHFEPDWRTVEGMLRGKIAGCQALIHIAGMRYGAEPEPATLPPGTARRSYTQMEYQIGCQLHEERGDAGFRVYTFVCPEGFAYDACEPEPEDKQALQRQHRTRLIDNPRLFEQPAGSTDLTARILALQEQVLSLQQEQVEVRKEVRRAHRTLWVVLAVLLVLGAGIFGLQRFTQQGLAELKAGQKHDPAAIKASMMEASTRKLTEDLAEAEKAAKSDERQRQRDAAQAAHASRLARIDANVAEYEHLASATDTTQEMREVMRILSDPKEGVDAALRYIQSQRAKLVAEEERLEKVHLEQRRARLQPLLTEAGLQATKGQTAEARASYQSVLKLDPQWPQALEAYVLFLYDQSEQTRMHGSLSAALADAQECLINAERFYELAPSETRTQRLLSVAHGQVADVLTLRGAAGDADAVFKHFTRASEISEKLLQASPDSAEVQRDVSVTVGRLGDFLAQRGQPGDVDAALKDYTRSLELREKLLQASPDSAQAARDVAVGLDKLGHLLVQHGQKDDADAALKYFSRSLEIREKLLQDSPGSAEAARDVSLSLHALGAFLSQRGQPDDAAAALKYFTRQLEICEKILHVSPDSVQAGRDVFVSLTKVGNLLAQRGQPGDADTALSYLKRSLEICEKLLQANPDSALAMRDVSMSLTGLGDFLEERGQPGDMDAALGYFTRSLEIRDKLLQANPGSAQAVRDVVGGHYNLSLDLMKQGDQAGAKKEARACYDLLHDRISKGMIFDAPIMGLHERLHAQFGTKP